MIEYKINDTTTLRVTYKIKDEDIIFYNRQWHTAIGEERKSTEVVEWKIVKNDMSTNYKNLKNGSRKMENV